MTANVMEDTPALQCGSGGDKNRILMGNRLKKERWYVDGHRELFSADEITTSGKSTTDGSWQTVLSGKSTILDNLPTINLNRLRFCITYHTRSLKVQEFWDTDLRTCWQFYINFKLAFNVFFGSEPRSKCAQKTCKVFEVVSETSWICINI